MKAAEHSPTAEQVMACLDGELPAERAAEVHAHLAGCDECRRVGEALKKSSRAMHEWQVDEPPAALRMPPLVETKPPVRQSGFAWLASSARAQFAAAAGLVVVLMLVAQVSMNTRTRRTASLARPSQTASSQPPEPVGTRMSSPAAAAAEMGGVPAQPPGRNAVGGLTQPQIARTARLRIVSSDFDGVRSALDRTLQEVGGFVGQIDVSGARGEPRNLTATLRVPADKLDQALAALKRLGTVVEESQASDDVTEQVVDLDARLSNARNTEKRLVDLLQQRTAKVSDVLEAEREVARVREEIERLDARRKNLARRVTYAIVTLRVSEQREASLDLGPLPMSAQLRNALMDGLRGAFSSIVEAALILMRIGPFVLLWVAILAWPARLVLRRMGKRPAES
jgi:primosomal protein N''